MIEKFKGKQVSLRPVFDQDMDDFVRFMNDFEASLFTGSMPGLYTADDERDYFKKSEDKRQFAVDYQGKLIGLVELFDIDLVNRRAVLGIMIGQEEARSKGLGYDVINLVLDYGFYLLNLHSISLTCFTFNHRAQALYKKCGFQEIGRWRQSRYLAGDYYDTLYMDILKEDHEPYLIYQEVQKTIGKYKK